MRCWLPTQRWVNTRSGLKIVFFQIVITALIVTFLNLTANEQARETEAGITSRELLQAPSKTQQNDNPSAMSLCPVDPRHLPELVGRFKTKINKSLSIHHAAKEIKNLLPGGGWTPKNCFSRSRLAVIIPYRDREFHLTLLLSVLHPMLQKQMLDYRIFVIEQNGTDIFNKGKIMNSGFLEARNLYNFDCVVFHDVDVIPEDDRNLYTCPTQPKHMSPSISRHRYQLKYALLVGGVLMFKAVHFEKVNGYSNLYPGWGGEDDDMANRILQKKLKITRPQPQSIGRYFVVEHLKRSKNPARQKILRTSKSRQIWDGLNSVHYKVVHSKNLKLFTHILIDVSMEPLDAQCIQRIPGSPPPPATSRPTRPPPQVPNQMPKIYVINTNSSANQRPAGGKKKGWLLRGT